LRGPGTARGRAAGLHSRARNGGWYDPRARSDELFIVFGDSTNGKETYGGGRFLAAAKPGPDGVTTLDFNRAYNPPCAFTPFATCPLPPKENRLAVRVEAGEKKYAKGHS
jgi:uncharacterized protein (DUF1684 family)